jgi:hypothetical protein
MGEDSNLKDMYFIDNYNNGEVGLDVDEQNNYNLNYLDKNYNNGNDISMALDEFDYKKYKKRKRKKLLKSRKNQINRGFLKI